MNELAQPPSIGVAFTCHNRRETTLRCLEQISRQIGTGIQFLPYIYLVDDGSTDGTPEAISRSFPWVRILPGSGNLFWSGGMNLALNAAIDDGLDFAFWLNDDVTLHDNALSRLIATYHSLPQGSIVVGATRWFNEERCSYGGLRLRQRGRPTSLVRIPPATGEVLPIDTFNGNVVLVPRSTLERVGVVDRRFAHAYGDLDYGLRASSCGVIAYLAPGYVGRCDGNGTSGTWADKALSRRRRLELLFDRKGIPPKSHLIYLRRHGSRVWPLWFLASYLKAISSVLLPRTVLITVALETFRSLREERSGHIGAGEPGVNPAQGRADSVTMKF
jgi:GT2 family glycosyltransferase